MKKNCEPLVSIIINCFNGSQYLKTTLLSIINQTYTNFEVIFWDNQSTDESKEIFLSYKDIRFKYFYAKNHTVLYKARNLAIEKSSGKYIALIDTDDWWEPDKLRDQINKFREDNYALIYTNMNIVYQKKSRFGFIINWIISKLLSRKFCNIFAPQGFILRELLYHYQVGLPSIVFKKEVFDSFNDNYHIIGDYDFVIRLSKKYKIGYINKCLTNYRVHGFNESMIKRDTYHYEMSLWYEKMKLDSEINHLTEFKYHKNKIDYIKAVEALSAGKYKFALKVIFTAPNSFWKYRLRLLVLVISPRIIIKILRT